MFPAPRRRWFLEKRLLDTRQHAVDVRRLDLEDVHVLIAVRQRYAHRARQQPLPIENQFDATEIRRLLLKLGLCNNPDFLGGATSVVDPHEIALLEFVAFGSEQEGERPVDNCLALSLWRKRPFNHLLLITAEFIDRLAIADPMFANGARLFFPIALLWRIRLVRRRRLHLVGRNFGDLKAALVGLGVR